MKTRRRFGEKSPDIACVDAREIIDKMVAREGEDLDPAIIAKVVAHTALCGECRSYLMSTRTQ